MADRRSRQPGNYQNAWLWGPGDGRQRAADMDLEDTEWHQRLSIEQLDPGAAIPTACNGAGSGACSQRFQRRGHRWRDHWLWGATSHKAAFDPAARVA